MGVRKRGRRVEVVEVTRAVAVVVDGLGGVLFFGLQLGLCGRVEDGCSGGGGQSGGEGRGGGWWSEVVKKIHPLCMDE